MDLQTPQSYTQWGLPPGAKARIGKGTIGNIRYSPDGTQLAVTCSIGIWLYDTRTCTELAFLRPGQNQGTPSLPLSWSGTTLIDVNWDDTISLWDAHTGERRITAMAHTEGVWSIALSPDGKTLVSAGWDKTIRFWDSRTGRLLFAVIGHPRQSAR